MNLEAQIEAILFFKNEPVTLAELSKLLNTPRENLQFTISNLQKECSNRGIVLVTNGDQISLGTHPDLSALIENLQKEELSRELSRASLETLSIVLYRGPVSRRDIDYIRGVNSSFILRSLLVRGLVERDEAGRSYNYKPTIRLLQYLGIGKREDLPEYESASGKINEFIKTATTEEDGSR